MIHVSLNDILDMWIGSSEKNLHEIFELARNNKPCILFICEIYFMIIDLNGVFQDIPLKTRIDSSLNVWCLGTSTQGAAKLKAWLAISATGLFLQCIGNTCILFIILSLYFQLIGDSALNVEFWTLDIEGLCFNFIPIISIQYSYTINVGFEFIISHNWKP